MTYTPKTWIDLSDLIYTDLNHIELQYMEIMSYLNSHNHDARYYTKTLSNSYFWNTGNDGAGSTLDADKLGGKEASAITGGAEIGIGGYYYGTLDGFTDGVLDVDPTWHICDGTDGTINILDVFVIGAGSFAVGSSGGNSSFKPHGTIVIDSHVLTLSEIMHTHALVDYYGKPKDVGTASIDYGYFTPGYALDYNITSTTSVGTGGGHNHTSTFAGASHGLLPPYRTLIPIQKIS